jgi:hypothetical protein
MAYSLPARKIVFLLPNDDGRSSKKHGVLAEERKPNFQEK